MIKFRYETLRDNRLTLKKKVIFCYLILNLFCLHKESCNKFELNSFAKMGLYCFVPVSFSIDSTELCTTSFILKRIVDTHKYKLSIIYYQEKITNNIYTYSV